MIPRRDGLLGGLLALLSLAGAALAQDQGCGNVTISSAADADAIRKSCKIITGNLIFNQSFAETVNLDGIEVVEGDFQHTMWDYPPACRDEQPPNCPGPFTISSSTLRQIKGDLNFWAFTGLEKLILPKLNRVGGSFGLSRMDELTTLDITGLEYVGGFQLEAQNLQSFSLEGLKEFTGPDHGYVRLTVGGTVEDLDGLFKNALDPYQGDEDDAEAYQAWIATQSGTYLTVPNLKRLTFGWKRIPKLLVSTPRSDTVVTLGGPNSTDMWIGSLEISDNVAKIARGSQVKNLTVKEMTLRYSTGMEQLDLPFDDLRTLEIFNASALTSVVLPSAAENWGGGGFRLSVVLSPNINMTSDGSSSDGGGEKSWYWPKGDMDWVNIDGSMTNEFFASFLQQRTENLDLKVKNHFWLNDRSGQLDCTPFEELQNKTNNRALSDSFSCYSKKSSAAASVRRWGGDGNGSLILWQVGMTLVGGVVIGTGSLL